MPTRFPNRSHFRKRRNYWLACLAELLAPLGRWHAKRSAPEPATNPATWRRGIIMLNDAMHIGDALYNTASLPHLQAGLPQCEWFYLVSHPADEVLKNNPHLAGCVVWNEFGRGTKALAKELRKYHFDAALCYGLGTSWRDLLLAIEAGIPNRVAHAHKGFAAWVTHPISTRFPQPYPGYFRDAVGTITGLLPDWPLRPIVYPGEEDRRQAAAAWEHWGLGDERPTVACFVTSRQPTGVWPAELFGRVIALLNEAPEVQILLCGSASDRTVLEALRLQFRLRCVINAGEVSLLPLVCCLARCRAVFCADSGPRHLANAAGVPVFFLRNLWFDRVEAGHTASWNQTSRPKTNASRRKINRRL